jgi:hypothetical protein
MNSHPLFDIEAAIIANHNQPSPVDLKAWQGRIDAIVGKTATGQSRLRIVWGQAAEMISCGRVAKKYLFYRHQEGGQFHDIGIPRFYIEELHPNSELQQKQAWDRARYYFDEYTRELIDVLGPIPEEGFYSSLFQIAHHDDLCCKGKETVKGEPCLGAYREPNESDLTRIRRMQYRRDHASNAENNPSEELIRKRAADMSTKRDEMWRKNIREAIEDYTKTRGHSWTTCDPAALQHGKYHWVGSHTKSGATAEQIAAWRKEKAINAGNSDSAKVGA